MQFEQSRTGERVGEVVGYLLGYALFTAVLGTILFFTAHWHPVRTMLLTIGIALLGKSLERLLR